MVMIVRSAGGKLIQTRSPGRGCQQIGYRMLCHGIGSCRTNACEGCIKSIWDVGGW